MYYAHKGYIRKSYVFMEIEVPLGEVPLTIILTIYTGEKMLIR